MTYQVYASCTFCGDVFHYLRENSSQKSRELCDTCYRTRKSHAKSNGLDENKAELVELRRAFLRLSYDSETDNIRKGDAVIVVQGNTKEQVYAHRFILSNRSPVFAKMFDTKMLEEDTGLVLMEDATLPVIRAVVKFCYDAEIDFTDEVTAEDVMEAAHKYDIALLQAICEEHLIRTLTNENLPRRLKLCKKLEAIGLQVAASKYFKDNFDSVIRNILVELC